MKNNLPFVSIITVNYNGGHYLDNCFTSLLCLNYPIDRVEILMVDNGSSDNSLRYVKEWFPKVKIINNDSNNYARANNLGIKQAKGEYVALLNNDTKVEKDWLIELVKVIESDKRIGSVGSKLLLPDGRIQNAGHIASVDFYWEERGFGEENLKYNEVEEVDSLCGAAALYRKKVFQEIGGFDEDFVMYMEDVDMAFRLKKNGWKVVFVPNSIIYHFFHGSGDNDLSRFYIEKNRLLFIAKHYPDKLKDALLGRGYFSVQNKLDYLGKIYDILPDVVIKLQKHHDAKMLKSALDGLTRELKEVANYESNILVNELSFVNNQLGQLKQNMSRLQDNFSTVESILQQKQKELRGIYSSEGYRFLLRPIWTFLWEVKNTLRFIKYSIKELVYFIIFAMLYLINLFIFTALLLEGILWRSLRFFRKNNTGKLNQEQADARDKKITIVIPNYNAPHYLKECLSSIFKMQDFQDAKHEVLVVDDASSDDSIDFVKTNFPQVTLIRNNKNLGFGASCNLGIKQAKNEIIILLNNDIIVSEGFYKPLIAHFDNRDIFSVSPRLYEWDRKTFITGMYMGHFEQGYVHIWNEREIFERPVINTAAETIFGIGCAVSFRKSDFLAMGGFDEIFKPYCWEDIDLSYRALKRGLRVIYEPKSTLFHKMHGTIGPFKRSIEIKNELLFTWKNITDFDRVVQHFLFLPLYFSKRKKERKPFLKGYLLALNELPRTVMHRIRERHYALCSDKEVFPKPLEAFNYFVNTKRKFLQDNLKKPKTLLLITPFLPYPSKSGGQIKMFTSLKNLREQYDVILVSFIERPEEQQYMLELNKFCKKVYTIVRRPTWQSRRNKIFLPTFIKYFYSKEMEEVIKHCIQTHPIDLVQIEYANMAYYAQFITGIPKILVEHDASIYTLNKSCEKPTFGKFFQFLDWLNFRRFQNNIYRHFDKIIAFTDEDARIVQRATPYNKVYVIPISIDVDSYKAPRDYPKEIDILFIGHMLHYPNVDGLQYFIREVFTLIKREIPNIKFHIIGSGIKKEQFGIKDDSNILVVGEVEDIKEYLFKTKVLVAPLRLGAGIKVKILEAMAAGVAVVADKEAVKGHKAINGKYLYIASSREDFANKVVDLLRDETKRKTMINNSAQLMREHYDTKKITKHEELIRHRLLLSACRILSYEDEVLFFEEETYSDKGPIIPSAGIGANWDFPLLMCNYNCPYCFNNDSSIDPNAPIINFKDAVNFWERMYYKYGEMFILVSGGEPTIFPNFFELLRKVNSWHRIKMITNLSFNIRKIMDNFSPQRLILHASFHPYSADIEEFAQKIRILLDKQWIVEPVVVGYPPLLDKLQSYKQKFAEKGIMGMCIIPFMGKYKNTVYPQGYTSAEKDLIFSIMRNRTDNKYMMDNICPKGKLCGTGFKFFKVHPDGSIRRCATVPTCLGNIKDKDFRLFEKKMPCEADFCFCGYEFENYFEGDESRIMKSKEERDRSTVR